MKRFEIDVSHADRALDSAIDDAMTQVRETEAKVTELEANHEDCVVNTYDLERTKAYVTGHARTPEWQQVIQRIGAGELTWEYVVTDRGASDPGVAAAYESFVRVPPLDEDGVRQLAATFQAAIAQPTPEPPPAPEQPVRDDSHLEDEEYFDGVQHWRAT